MSLQISVRESDEVAILDLQGRLPTGEDGELLSRQLRKIDRQRQEETVAQSGEPYSD